LIGGLMDCLRYDVLAFGKN